MKEIEIVNIPEYATVLRAHEGDYEGTVPKTHIIEIFRHMGGDLILTYDNHFDQFIRIRHADYRQIEIHTKNIPFNDFFSVTMLRDI